MTEPIEDAFRIAKQYIDTSEQIHSEPWILLLANEVIAKHDLLYHLVHQLMSRHPLPWRIEWDWTCEVLDANHQIVLKLMREKDAHGLIAMANRLAEEDRLAAIEMKELFPELEDGFEDE